VEHWTAVKNILKYLNRTKEMFLVYGGDEELIVKGYVDASFDTDLDDSKSQTGYTYILNGGAVIRLKRIYNFLCYMLVLTPFA
jgi:hypothetical protein